MEDKGRVLELVTRDGGEDMGETVMCDAYHLFLREEG